MIQQTGLDKSERLNSQELYKIIDYFCS